MSLLRVARVASSRRVGVRHYQGGRGGGSFTPSPFSSSPTFSAERPPWNPGFVIVPQQKAFVVERLGRFSTTLTAGFYLLVPFLDRVAYVHSLKETALSIPSQAAITRDNVTISIDGVLYVRINDPHAASYGVSDPIWALTQLAQTTMRSELGKYSLDRTFSERESLNSAIVTAINDAARSWGIECLRYEIRDINPPASLTQAMSLQAEAERRKRADILESEGRRCVGGRRAAAAPPPPPPPRALRRPFISAHAGPPPPPFPPYTHNSPPPPAAKPPSTPPRASGAARCSPRRATRRPPSRARTPPPRRWR